QRHSAFDMPTFLRGYRSEVGEPGASLATSGISLSRALWKCGNRASLNAHEHVGSYPRSLCFDWTPASAPSHMARVQHGCLGAAPLPNLALTGEWDPFSHCFE